MTTSTRTRTADTTTRVRGAVAAAATLGAFALSACNVSASANLTASPEEIATEAEDAIEDQIGPRPEIDCGDEEVDLVDGTVVGCELTDAITGSVFAMSVTLSDVDGSAFEILVEVAEEPKA